MTSRPRPESKEEKKVKKKDDINKRREKYSLAILTANLINPTNEATSKILVNASVHLADLLIEALDEKS